MSAALRMEIKALEGANAALRELLAEKDIRDCFPDTGSALADRLREDYPELIGGDPDGGF